MRRLLLIITLVVTFFVTSKAQDAYIDAIGLRGGPLSGISYKRFVWPVNGVIEGIAGFNYLNGRTYSFTGLYEHHLFMSYHLNFFAGGGTTLAFNADTFRWVAEGIVGLELLLDTMPLLISIDYKPGWSILDQKFVFNEAALSVRYILNQ